jgi:hypothetical protein
VVQSRRAMSVAGDPTVEHGVDFELELDDIDP